jgi:hypothetical protein
MHFGATSFLAIDIDAPVEQYPISKITMMPWDGDRRDDLQS